jgi:hypothetical protein
MNERLFQFLWQFQYFNKKELQTTEGENLQIIFQGNHNSNQGPDFMQAKIKVADNLLVGNIELHIRSSDWNKHGHQTDPLYKNIILHVVWEADQKATPPHVPLLELQDRIPKALLEQYNDWMQQRNWIPCSQSIMLVPEITWKSWKDRLVAERLERKAAYVLASLNKNKQHWELTFWHMLAKNFGISINASAFESIAQSLPVNLLAKHKNQLISLEAMLLGQAGLLQKEFTEEYPRLLQREYRFLQQKYQLIPSKEPVQFLRMRPAAFPTIRLAQLAMLIHQSLHLFSKIREIGSLQSVIALLDAGTNEYWHTHYILDEPSAYRIKKLGPGMLQNLVINTLVPVLYAYGNYQQLEEYKAKGLRWLQEMKPEQNKICSGWALLGVESSDAFSSQALIELRNEYCVHKRCLDCAVGTSILKRGL